MNLWNRPKIKCLSDWNVTVWESRNCWKMRQLELRNSVWIWDMFLGRHLVFRCRV